MMYSFYRGTNFQFAGQMQDDGVIQDLTGASLQANVYDPSGTTLIAVLSCTITGDPKLGIVTVAYSGDTTHWPVGRARIDMLLNLPNNPHPIASDPILFRIAQTPIIG